MKTLLLLSMLILSLNSFSQFTKGTIRREDTALFKPSADVRQIIQHTDGKPYLWVGTYYVPMLIEPMTVPSASMGTATLVAGLDTVLNTRVTASSKIFLTRNTAGGTVGVSLAVPTAGISAGVYFIVKSVAANGTVSTSDTSTFNWWIVN